MITEFLGLILFALAPQILGLFTDKPEVIKIGALQTHIITPFYFLLAFSHGMSGIMRGAGHSKTPMFIMIICWVCVRIFGIPFVLSWDGFNQISTIFWFYPFTWSLSFVALNIINLLYRKHQKREVLYE